jgi:O-antigen ligase
VKTESFARWFDDAYPRFIFWGLVGIIWFAALARGARDLWAACVVFVATTFLVLIFLVGTYRQKTPLQLPLLVPWGLIFGTMLLSRSFACDLENFQIELWGWFFALVIFYLFMNIVDTEARRLLFFRASGSVLFVIGAVAGAQYWTNRAAAPNIQISGTLVNPMILAGFSLNWMFLAWRQRAEDRWFVWLFAAGALLLFGTMQRSALVLAFGGIACAEARALARAPSRHEPARYLFVLLGLLTIAALYAKHQHNVELERVASHVSGARLSYWAAALALWQHAPWFGVGLGGFGTAYSFVRTAGVENTLFAHSFPLQLLAETGLLGATAWALLIIDLIHGHRATSPVSKPRRFSAYEWTLVIVLLYSLVSINLDYWINKVLCLCLLGAVCRNLPSKPRRLPGLWMAALGVVLFFLTPFWLSPWVASRIQVAGEKAEQAGRLDAAERAYRTAVEVNPQNAESYWHLFNLYANRYLAHPNPEDMIRADDCIMHALSNKKDLLYFKGLAHFRRALAKPQ